MEYVVETYAVGPFRNYEAFDLKTACRKAAKQSKGDDVSYVVAMEGGERVGHRVYANGRFLRQEGEGF